MEQADSANTQKPEKTQSIRDGYIIGEDKDFALLEIARGLDAVAQLCEDREGDLPEIPPVNLAALLRVFGRAAQEIYDSAGWTKEAMARSRH